MSGSYTRLLAAGLLSDLLGGASGGGSSRLIWLCRRSSRLATTASGRRDLVRVGQNVVRPETHLGECARRERNVGGEG